MASIPANCGPVHVVADGPVRAPDPFTRYDSALSRTDFTLSADRRMITGQVRNDSRQRVGHLAIYFAAYNAKGEKLADPIAIGANLDPGEVWNVEAPVWTDAVDHIAVKQIDWSR